MSYGDNIRIEREIDYAVLYATVQAQARKGIWETKDGRKIPVEEMTTSHIRNTISMLKRHNVCDLWEAWIQRFERELERREEGEE